MKLIPHSRPTLNKEESNSVARIISSGHIAGGDMVEAFESEVAGFVGVKGGVAVSSGTAALHLSLLALGVGEGDEIIIPDYSCVALLNAVTYVGAVPKIVDIVPGEYNMNPVHIKKRLSKKTKAIMLVHTFGLPMDAKEIRSIGFPVVEDMAQAIGASYAGKMIGSFGQLSVASFYATKLFTTGEGGMILSNSLKHLEKVRDLRDYDERNRFKVRFNYKMTDMQAAMGLSQLKKLPEFVMKRQKIAKYYTEKLEPLPIHLPRFSGQRGHIYYRYIIEVKKKDLLQVINSLKEEGVDVRRPIYKPLHKYLGERPLKNSVEAWKKSISIPIYPSLTREDKEQVVKSVREVVSRL